jgi:WhiB family transcriptional regulator, redox-sensing transcriptional regulator
MTTPATGRSGHAIPRVSPRYDVAWPGPWARQALCAQAGPDAWFPDKGEADLARAAAKVCARCPVSGPCLAHALATREPHGIWGGLTARQRYQLLAERENAA